jgi:hypothetical protein
MKNKLSHFIIIILIAVFGILGNSYLKNDISTEQSKTIPKPVKSIKEVLTQKISTEIFDEIKLFNLKSSDIKNIGLGKYMKSCSKLTLKSIDLKNLYNSKKENIELSIPLSGHQSITLQLTRTKILSDDFRVNYITENGKVPVDYKPGLFYNGIIKDKPNTHAAISIFENSVMGIVADESGNYNLGPANENYSGDEYLFYNESDLLVKNSFKCNVDDYGKMRKDKKQNNVNNNDNITARQPVRVYFVADYQMYLDKGSNTSNYITGLFNEVAAIYQNEFLPVNISSIDVYTTPDPYRYMTTSDAVLIAFSDNIKDNFTGDFAHLLSTRNENFGGISWINSICQSYDPSTHFARTSFSGIDKTYSQFPTYSWTVTVVAHEMGHSYGSMHTHACWWPISENKIGQIDSCYANYPEETCINSTRANNSGTIMSYCHLNGEIDFYNGFGSMPGDTIRLRYNMATSCFGNTVNSSELPTNFELSQNRPNPFNPSTTINFAVPEDAFVTVKIYDISGREITTLINQRYYSRGYQSVVFNASLYNLSSGIYLYKLTASNSASGNIFGSVKKMILIK